MWAPGTLATRAEPAAFRAHRAAERALHVSAEFESAALALGLLEPGGLERALAGPSGRRGRSRTAILPLPGRAERLHLRPIHHGGWLQGVLRDRWLGLARALRELRTHARLHALGAPVPVPVLVAARRAHGFQRAALGTIHAEGALDGLALVASPLAPAARRAAALAAGVAVRALHAAGAHHADLHLGNLLFRERAGGYDALVIDFDRARLAAPPSARERMRELMRLQRSLVKRGVPAPLAARACADFLAAYTNGDRALRGALLRHLPRERARLALHALGYRLARLRRSG